MSQVDFEPFTVGLVEVGLAYGNVQSSFPMWHSLLPVEDSGVRLTLLSSSGSVNTHYYCMVAFIRLQCELLDRFQLVGLQLLHFPSKYSFWLRCGVYTVGLWGEINKCVTSCSENIWSCFEFFILVYSKMYLLGERYENPFPIIKLLI